MVTEGDGGALFRADRRVGVAEVDAGGLISAWGGGSEEVLGYRPSEVVGTPAARLLASAGDLPAVLAAMKDRDSSEGARGELALRHRDGHEVVTGIWACPVEGQADPGEGRWLVVLTPPEELRRGEEDRAVVEELFNQGPVGLAVFDTGLRYVRINAALEKMHGIPRSVTLGHRISDTFQRSDAAGMEARLRAVLRTGVPMATEHRGRTPADPDHEHVWAISSFRLHDADGRVLGVASSVLDITESFRTRERLLLLDEAGNRIGTTLDVGRTAEELTEVAVPRLADFAAVDLLEGIARGQEYVPGPVGGNADMRRAAIRSVLHHAPESSYAVGELIRFHPATPQAQCMATGEAILLRTLDDAQVWLAQDPVRGAKMRAAGVHSVLIVPLRARDVTLGVVHFYRWQRPEAFAPDDLLVAEEFAARAAVCLDNARRYTREHYAALTLQRRLLQGPLAEQESAEVAYRYRPAGAHAGVAGDWFDVIALSGARVALVAGDVPGRGIHAIARAGRLRLAIHTLAQMDVAPDELLSQLDHTVSRATGVRPGSSDSTAGAPAADDGRPEDPTRPTESAESADSADEIGATCLYVVYDPVTRQCTMASAGHLPPAVVAPDGTTHWPELQVGPPLGLGGLPFETTVLKLPEGSILALFTNGLIDGFRGDVTAKLATLHQVLGRPARTLEDTCEAAVSALGLPDSPDDDAVLLLARTRVLGADRVASWDLPADPAVVARARAVARRQLRDWQLEETVSVAELVVSELVTNAMRYGREPIRLRLIRGLNLICEVSDGSSTSPHMRHAADTDEGGRGLFMIGQLADRWGTRYTTNGKTIWAECAL